MTICTGISVNIIVEFNVVTRNAVIGSREECCIGEKLAEQP